MTEYGALVENLDPPTALKIVCLFLAQKARPEQPHVMLGYSTWSEAYDHIAGKFGTRANTVKNERDAFDRWTDSSRVGWKSELRPSLKKIWDEFGQLKPGNLLQLAKDILGREWRINEMDELPDLPSVIAQTRDLIETIEPEKRVRVSKTIMDAILETYQTAYPNDKILSVGEHTLYLANSSGQARYVSVQEFPLLVALTENVRALEKYRIRLDSIADRMGITSRGNEPEVFGSLPSEAWETTIAGPKLAKLKSAINDEFASPGDRDRMTKFLSDPDWSGLRGGRKLDRASDWQESAVLKTGRMVASANAGRFSLVKVLAEAGVQFDDLEFDRDINRTSSGQNRLTGAENILYYGAPGTGKSHRVEEECKGGTVFTTVFHPDMQNSDFVGSLKPSVDTQGAVSYNFRPGPFARALVHSWINPGERVYLVIEELNRAMAAAVFGELFQLLDRKPDGGGKYMVDCPSPEFAEWYQAQTGSDESKLKLPSNLWIRATMNSADQGVYPLDTAFRRRWRQEYIGLDYSIAPISLVKVARVGLATIEEPWSEFVGKLNRFLVEELDVPEDRLVGPRFLDENDIEAGRLPGKLLIYLWDDLLRHHGRNVLFQGTLKTYGALDLACGNGEPVFGDRFVAYFAENNADPDLDAQEVEI